MIADGYGRSPSTRDGTDQLDQDVEKHYAAAWKKIKSHQAGDYADKDPRCPCP